MWSTNPVRLSITVNDGAHLPGWYTIGPRFVEVSYDVCTMTIRLTMHFSECISVVKWHVSVLHTALSVACSDVREAEMDKTQSLASPSWW